VVVVRAIRHSKDKGVVMVAAPPSRLWRKRKRRMGTSLRVERGLWAAARVLLLLLLLLMDSSSSRVLVVVVVVVIVVLLAAGGAVQRVKVGRGKEDMMKGLLMLPAAAAW